MPEMRSLVGSKFEHSRKRFQSSTEYLMCKNRKRKCLWCHDCVNYSLAQLMESYWVTETTIETTKSALQDMFRLEQRFNVGGYKQLLSSIQAASF